MILTQNLLDFSVFYSYYFLIKKSNFHSLFCLFYSRISVIWSDYMQRRIIIISCHIQFIRTIVLFVNITRIIIDTAFRSSTLWPFSGGNYFGWYLIFYMYHYLCYFSPCEYLNFSFLLKYLRVFYYLIQDLISYLLDNKTLE